MADEETTGSSPNPGSPILIIMAIVLLLSFSGLGLGLWYYLKLNDYCALLSARIAKLRLAQKVPLTEPVNTDDLLSQKEKEINVLKKEIARLRREIRGLRRRKVTSVPVKPSLDINKIEDAIQQKVKELTEKEDALNLKESELVRKEQDLHSYETRLKQFTGETNIDE